MSKATEVKTLVKMQKKLLNDEISSLKKNIKDYKTERKTHWTNFKAKTKDDIAKIERSVEKLHTRIKK